MNQYVTGAIIKRLREEKGFTQSRFADILNVSDKTVSKWETAKGYPDITLIEPIAKALGISVMEFLSGDNITNENRSFNMKKIKFYVCPICGNVITAMGESLISCCGITLPPLEAEQPEEPHALAIQQVEDEYYVTVEHEMSKQHYISFLAGVSDNGIQLVKFYPEGNAQARLKKSGMRAVYYYCNRHGRFRQTI